MEPFLKQFLSQGIKKCRTTRVPRLVHMAHKFNLTTVCMWILFMNLLARYMYLQWVLNSTDDSRVPHSMAWRHWTPRLPVKKSCWLACGKAFWTWTSTGTMNLLICDWPTCGEAAPLLHWPSNHCPIGQGGHSIGHGKPVTAGHLPLSLLCSVGHCGHWVKYNVGHWGQCEGLLGHCVGFLGQ